MHIAHQNKSVAVIGGGPAGLMAAEVLMQGGASVTVFDAMPSVGRKFLMAGVGGLNITHAEPITSFLARYGARHAQIAPWLDNFSPDALRQWMLALGIDSFVGSSGRVFPRDMKAAPLLRAWLHRLRAGGVHFRVRHRWLGWRSQGALYFANPAGEQEIAVDAVVLALGGGSWARLGSDAAWVPWLAQRGVEITPLRPANCGFDVAWSTHFKNRFAGQAIKSVALRFTDHSGASVYRRGELMATVNGVEGSLIYALSAALREEIAACGGARIELDLLPDVSLVRVMQEVTRPRGARSQSSHLQSRLGLTGVKANLLREVLSASEYTDAARLSATIKALPLTLLAPRPLDEAISSAGGISFAALDKNSMLAKLPGVFCAGEMLDWEAPTGGYLLTACLASGRAAGSGVLSWLNAKAAGGSA